MYRNSAKKPQNKRHKNRCSSSSRRRWYNDRNFALYLFNRIEILSNIFNHHGLFQNVRLLRYSSLESSNERLLAYATNYLEDYFIISSLKYSIIYNDIGMYMSRKDTCELHLEVGRRKK